MSEEKTIHYKQYSIGITPHDERCSHYAYVIRDDQGREIKHVRMGGDTQDVAQANAQKMIDFEIDYQREKQA